MKRICLSMLFLVILCGCNIENNNQKSQKQENEIRNENGNIIFNAFKEDIDKQEALEKELILLEGGHMNGTFIVTTVKSEDSATMKIADGCVIDLELDFNFSKSIIRKLTGIFDSKNLLSATPCSNMIMEILSNKIYNTVDGKLIGYEESYDDSYNEKDEIYEKVSDMLLGEQSKGSQINYRGHILKIEEYVSNEESAEFKISLTEDTTE